MKIKIEVLHGCEGNALIINDYRVCGRINPLLRSIGINFDKNGRQSGTGRSVYRFSKNGAKTVKDGVNVDVNIDQLQDKEIVW
jgi:hypothetical protein